MSRIQGSKEPKASPYQPLMAETIHRAEDPASRPPSASVPNPSGLRGYSALSHAAGINLECKIPVAVK
jgi:hypothetical protein